MAVDAAQLLKQCPASLGERLALSRRVFGPVQEQRARYGLERKLLRLPFELEARLAGSAAIANPDRMAAGFERHDSVPCLLPVDRNFAGALELIIARLENR